MRNSVRVLASVSVLLVWILAIEAPAFGQTSVVVEVRVLELTPMDLDALRISPTSPSFARALSREMDDYLKDSSRSKSVHRVELQATSGNATEFRLDSRVSSSPGLPLEAQTFFNVGFGIDVTPRAFQNRDVLLTTVSQVRIRRGPDADGGQPVIFENPPTTFETRIHEGVTIILGGFITDAEKMKLPSIPMVTDNPIVNYLFSKRSPVQSSSELVVLLTPRIEGGVMEPDPPVIIRNTPVAPAVPAPAPASAPVRAPAASVSANTPSVKETRTQYTVQVGAFENREKAEALVAQLSKKYSGAFIDRNPGETLYHVRVGRLPDAAAARQLQSQLTRDGFDTYITTVN